MSEADRCSDPQRCWKWRPTAGTNSAAQKAQFIRAAFDAIERAVAPDSGLEPATYIQVRELSTTDWGYGGCTQETRRRQREAA